MVHSPWRHPSPTLSSPDPGVSTRESSFLRFTILNDVRYHLTSQYSGETRNQQRKGNSLPLLLWWIQHPNKTPFLGMWIVHRTMYYYVRYVVVGRGVVVVTLLLAQSETHCNPHSKLPTLTRLSLQTSFSSHHETHSLNKTLFQLPTFSTFSLQLKSLENLYTEPSFRPDTSLATRSHYFLDVETPLLKLTYSSPLGGFCR